MSGLRTALAKCRALADRGRADARLRDEIALHLEMLEGEFRARGCSPAEARIQARRAFGSVDRVRESARDARGWVALDTLRGDVRSALRQLRASRSFAAAALLTLAIGIGGTTGIFSVLDVVAFRALPYPDGDRLVVVHEGFPRFGPFPASVADAEFWSRHVTSFEPVALVLATFMNLTGAGEPERLQVGLASPGLLAMLGAEVRLGRLPTDSEAQRGADDVLLLSEGLWKRRFAGDPDIVGRVISLDGRPHQVIGVLHPRFRAPDLRHLYAIPMPEMVVQAWKPLAVAPEDRVAAGGYSYPAVTKLKAGVSIERAQQELDAVQAELRRAVPAKADLYARIVPLQDQMASRSRTTLFLLMGATAAVLLIGCINTTNLLLARLLARRRELAIRAALGAGRWRLMRQIVVENLVLGAVGGTLGLAVAYGVIRTIVAIAPADVPRLDEFALDGRALLFAAVVSTACGLGIGIPSAWRLAGGDLRAWLVSRTNGAGAGRLHAALVVCEIGACAACLGVTLLLAQSLRELTSVDKGFDASHVLTASISVPLSRYATPEQQGAFFAALADDLRARPGVVGVAITTQLPLTGTGALSALSVAGTTVAAPERPSADVRSVTPAYFSLLNLHATRGRLLEPKDGDRAVAVLSEHLAAQAWPGLDPLGRRFRFGLNPAAPEFEVVGIVTDVRGTALDQPPTPTAYVPFPQRTRSTATIMVRTTGEPLRLAPVVREAIRAHDGELPLPQFQTFDDVIAGSLEARRFQLTVVALFAATALALAAIGVFGVMAYAVAQRRGELGVRLALGAHPRTLLLLVIRRAVWLGILGLGAAVPLAWLAGSSIRTLLYGVSPLDPAALAITAGVMLLTAVSASTIPAIRASRLQPAVALRHE